MSPTTANIIAKLANEHNLSDAELLTLLTGTEDGINEQLACAADKLRRQYYGDKVYIRGLIEFTNYCKNNCYYCGIRAGNSLAERYRLSQEEILACCAEGYRLGFRTFVLQGGEDLYYTDDKICSIVSAIRRQHPDCAITLSIGEKSRASYLQQLQPDMIGIGPYITHEHTPFKDRPSGTLEQTLRLLSMLRLLFPYALLPSTTALGTIHPEGRELGLKAGGNVVMPNLSPVGVRKKYELYANKICTGEEAAQCRGCLEARVRMAGYNIVTDIGDVRRTLE